MPWPVPVRREGSRAGDIIIVSLALALVFLVVASIVAT